LFSTICTSALSAPNDVNHWSQSKLWSAYSWHCPKTTICTLSAESTSFSNLAIGTDHRKPGNHQNCAQNEKQASRWVITPLKPMNA